MTGSSPRTIKLTFISDFWCPWCYIGYREIRAAIDKCTDEKLPLKFNLEYRPFVLGPTLSEDTAIPRFDYLKDKYGVDKANAIYAMVGERAKPLGIDLSKAGPVRSTVRAHRLMLRAYQLGGSDLQSKLLAAVFEAHGEQNKDVGDPETLARIADNTGVLAYDDALAFLNSSELAAEVQRMIDMARSNGVAGVPFTVIDDKWAISGGQAPDVYYKIFRKLAGMPDDAAPSPAPEPPVEPAAVAAQ